MSEIYEMIPVSELKNKDVIALSVRAREYIRRLPWWKAITDEYLAWALCPIVEVFYFFVEPKRTDIDKELWGIVGDLPPAYIVCDSSDTWQEALDAYAFEMMKWVKAVRNGESVKNFIPVNVEPSEKYADMLESRLKFLLDEFVDKPIDTYPTDS
jgi:hypothetical protein